MSSQMCCPQSFSVQWGISRQILCRVHCFTVRTLE